MSGNVKILIGKVMPASILDFKNVGLRYGQGPEILQEITFHLPPGSFHFLTGESGAGKTSLLSLISMIQRPTRGQVTLFGREISKTQRSELPILRRRIGMVFQDFRLLDHLSAVDNVALPLRVCGVPESEARKHVHELLSWVGLGDSLHATPPTLSGGQQQRIAIARAVINRPALLLADEPTGNVDDRIAMRLLHLFVELNRMGTTIIIATHRESMIQQFNFPRLHLEDRRLKTLPAEAPLQTADSFLVPRDYLEAP